jgi:hypothetical protein
MAWTPAPLSTYGLYCRQRACELLTCSPGTCLNARQFRQLCDGPRTVYLTFDDDINSSGQQAAQSLAARLSEQGELSVNVRKGEILFSPENGR